MITSVDIVKHLKKNLHPFLRKSLNKLGIERNFLNLAKGIYENPKTMTEYFSSEDQEQDKDVWSYNFSSTLFWRF